MESIISFRRNAAVGGSRVVAVTSVDSEAVAMSAVNVAKVDSEATAAGLVAAIAAKIMADSTINRIMGRR